MKDKEFNRLFEIYRKTVLAAKTEKERLYLIKQFRLGKLSN